MKRIILAALVGVLVISTANAEFFSGNQLFTDCNGERPDEEAGCSGYIMGAMDTIISLQRGKLLDDRFQNVCLPEGVTAGQLVSIVKKYLTENPAERHFAASRIVVIGIRKAFPCKK